MPLDGLEVSESCQVRTGRLARSLVWRQANARWAGEGLRVRSPQYSAGTGFPWWQKCAPGLVLVLIVLVTFLMPRLGHAVTAVIISLPFLAIATVRLLALRWFVQHSVGAPGDGQPALTSTAINDDLLPVYSVLVPLYREADTVPGLVAAMAAIDYPCHRLEVFFVAESDDAETLAALQRCDLPEHMAVLAVPPGRPRTKPRALNYALAASTGDFVVIYDAEDTPEPGQLRTALQTFESGGPDLACVQARLVIHNRRDSLISRQFAVEYAALFECILPALHCFQLPIPLGGTSNHFRGLMYQMQEATG